MSHPLVRLYVIGQTPRPDLTRDLGRRLPTTSFEVVGALDDLSVQEIDAGGSGAYPLETRLRDGRRVVVDAGFVEARVRAALDAYEGDAVAHLILCAGPFPGLSAELSSSGPAARSTPPPIIPWQVAADLFEKRGYQRLEIVVPFSAQAAPAEAKWRTAGFFCRTHALSERPAETPLESWLSDRLERDADALVFDYVGFPSEELRAVADQVEIPTFDLGHLALDALQTVLDTRVHR